MSHLQYKYLKQPISVSMNESPRRQMLNRWRRLFFFSAVTDDMLRRACLLKLSSTLVTGTRLLLVYVTWTICVIFPSAKAQRQSKVKPETVLFCFVLLNPSMCLCSQGINKIGSSHLTCETSLWGSEDMSRLNKWINMDSIDLDWSL